MIPRVPYSPPFVGSQWLPSNPAPPTGPAHYPPLFSKAGARKKAGAVDKHVDWELAFAHVDEYGHKLADGATADGDGVDAGFEDPVARYPFLIQHVFRSNYRPGADGTMQTITTEVVKIEIRSPFLRDIGRKVIGDIQGISWSSKELKIEPNVFLAQFPDLETHLEQLKANPSPSKDDTNAISHLDLFLRYMQDEYAEIFEDISNLLEHQEMRFDLLWAILVPRTIFYLPCPVSDEPRAARLTRSDLIDQNNNCQIWRLHFECVDWFSQRANTAGDAAHFGLVDMPTVDIYEFKGTTKIRHLSAYPFAFHPESDELKEMLIVRGKKWCSLQGVHHMQYNGVAIDQGQPNLSMPPGMMGMGCFTVRTFTTGRIMLDRKAFSEMVPNVPLPVIKRNLDGADVDTHVRSSTADAAIRQLSDNDLLMTSPVLYGFSLTSKQWLIFTVKDISTFEWNDAVFDQLVLPPAQKTLVRSLIVSHKQEDSGFDDFIEGKGRGIVINIFGNPGVGKSLTAEATSEHLRKPLYIVGAGDLGTRAQTVDSNLSQIFKVSTKWGAVVLIDEADVFLEQRSFHDLERNAMVAVFLRQLEYFRGILFLTTNRVQTFDVAFQSRIHVALHYHDLNEAAKSKIWVGFMKKAHGLPHTTTADAPASSVGLMQEQLEALSKKDVNGRQIKNVVRTASALASAQGEKLAYEHLVHVLSLMDEFDVSSQSTTAAAVAPTENKVYWAAEPPLVASKL